MGRRDGEDLPREDLPDADQPGEDLLAAIEASWRRLQGASTAEQPAIEREIRALADRYLSRNF
jgi:hypothetical protein